MFALEILSATVDPEPGAGALDFEEDAAGAAVVAVEAADAAASAAAEEDEAASAAGVVPVDIVCVG